MRTTLSVVIAAIGSVAVMTGLLTIGFAVVARLHGYDVMDYYAELFPSYRGSAHAAMPRGMYVVYVIYLLTAAQLSLFLRRLLTRSSSGR